MQTNLIYDCKSCHDNELLKKANLLWIDGIKVSEEKRSQKDEELWLTMSKSPAL